MQAAHAQKLVDRELDRVRERDAGRQTVEAYVREHRLDTKLQDAVNQLVKERPADPLHRLERVLR